MIHVATRRQARTASVMPQPIKFISPSFGSPPPGGAGSSTATKVAVGGGVSLGSTGGRVLGGVFVKVGVVVLSTEVGV